MTKSGFDPDFMKIFLDSIFKDSDDPKAREDYAGKLGISAMDYCGRGDLLSALEQLKKQETICRDINNQRLLESCLGQQGEIFRRQGDFDAALKAANEEASICRLNGFKEDLHVCLGNKALTLIQKGSYKQAHACLEEKERICKEVNDMAGVASSIGSRAKICIINNELDKGLSLLQKEEDIYRSLGFGLPSAQLLNPLKVAECLANQAVVLEKKGEFKKAYKPVKEAYDIAKGPILFIFADPMIISQIESLYLRISTLVR